MPCRTILDVNGNTIGIACSRSPRRQCSTPGCTNNAALLCDYPVTRAKGAGTCDRPVCTRCAKHVGTDRDYCAAHARLAAEGKPTP